MSRKSILEQALEFTNKKPIFCYEDTNDRCYRDIIEAIENIGWKRTSYKKRSKLDRKKYAWDTMGLIFYFIYVCCDCYFLD
jgi:hypothetical protein